jgi:hypothetical protein
MTEMVLARTHTRFHTSSRSMQQRYRCVTRVGLLSHSGCNHMSLPIPFHIHASDQIRHDAHLDGVDALLGAYPAHA